MQESLPVLAAGESRSDEARQALMAGKAPIGWRYLVRLLLITLFAFGVQQHLRSRSASHLSTAEFDLEAVAETFPAVVAQRTSGRWHELLDADGKIVARAMMTAPDANHITGYSGPNNVLLLFSPDGNIVGTRLLDSADTVEHAELVRKSSDFWRQFEGMPLDRIREYPEEILSLDAVSGATLTSLAIVEAVAFRVAGAKLHLRFPAEVSLEESQALDREITSLVPLDGFNATVWAVHDADTANEQESNLDATRSGPFASEWSGSLIVRTGNLVDDIEGYQGPTELLLLFDSEEKLVKARLRDSYDNQPYVRYVQQEAGFWALFQGKTRAQIIANASELNSLEGVSGATMTSRAAAETLTTAIARLQRVEPLERQQPQWNLRWPEIVTIGLSLLALGWSFAPAQWVKKWRWIWQVVCLIALGIATGNLLSLALISGWLANGVPFRIAPGLSCLLLVSIASPMLLGRNTYCDHVCPHGIVQQWTRRRTRGAQGRGKSDLHLTRSRWPARLLSLSSWAILGYAASLLVLDQPNRLAWLEPFDTYAWRIGISASFIVWLVSLGFHFWRPMSYCQLGCPTGKILKTLRRSRRIAWWPQLDCVLACLCVLIWTLTLV